jgi:hypothetical protein
MLMIIDLNRYEELSSSGMGKVAGGMPCEQAAQLADALDAEAGVWLKLGYQGAADYCGTLAMGIAAGACGSPI